MVWEIVFMLLILKIPLVWVCVVSWWAIKSEPRPEQPAALVTASDDSDRSPWRSGRRPRRPGPHGRPSRGYARTRRATVRT